MRKNIRAKIMFIITKEESMIRRAMAGLLLLCTAALTSCTANSKSTVTSPATRAAMTSASESNAGFQTIHNDFYWVDQNGARINTRSGCLCKFNDVYYWYGGTNRFRDQTCYTSTDLVHWTFRGIVLSLDVDANRIDVLYNDTTRQYVMFLKYNGNGAHLAIATADKPEGPFTFRSQTLVDNALMGDMAAYKDTDGKAYLCYVSWAVGTNAQHGIYLMSPDYLTLEKRIYLWDIRSREAPHIFKRNGIYYYGTSRTAGIQSSGTSYYTATDLAGPWSPAKPLPTPGSNNSWDTQCDFVFPIQGAKGTVYMYAGDRWIKNQGRQGDYAWLPMEFDGDTPILNYYQDWELNLGAGTWRKFDASRDLAMEKTATASSDDGTNVARHVTAPKTFENYTNTRWESAASDPQWIMVDLSAPMDINRVILKWNANAAKAYKIQVSSDAAGWTDVYSTTQGSSYSITDETFKTTRARYVRMLATQRAPIPPTGRGGRGFGGRGRGPQSSTQQASTQPTVAQPVVQNGYSLFDFMVLRD